jgi:hypothetical protein
VLWGTAESDVAVVGMHCWEKEGVCEEEANDTNRRRLLLGVYNTPFFVGFYGVPGLLGHSVMSRDMPLYMLDDTVEDRSEEMPPRLW